PSTPPGRPWSRSCPRPRLRPPGWGQAVRRSPRPVRRWAAAAREIRRSGAGTRSLVGHLPARVLHGATARDRAVPASVVAHGQITRPLGGGGRVVDDVAPLPQGLLVQRFLQALGGAFGSVRLGHVHQPGTAGRTAVAGGLPGITAVGTGLVVGRRAEDAVERAGGGGDLVCGQLSVVRGGLSADR